MTDPKWLVDFLRDSYALGGIVSVLALDALFELIQSHNMCVDARTQSSGGDGWWLFCLFVWLVVWITNGSPCDNNTFMRQPVA